MRVIIACAGSQNKWKSYLGIRSHFVPDRDGEPILQRTVRLVGKIANPMELGVVAPYGLEDEYSLDGAYAFPGSGSSEFESSMPYWSPDGRTVLLLGDTYFTEDALRKILFHEGSGFMTFGRSERSKKTGSPWGEIFAYSWTSDISHRLTYHANLAKQAHKIGILYRCTGWEVLYSFQGTDLMKTYPGRVVPHWVDPEYFTEIDDLTDDIDYPVDYHRHPRFGGRLR